MLLRKGAGREYYCSLRIAIQMNKKICILKTKVKYP